MKRFQMPSLGLPRPQRLKANSALLMLPAAEFLLWIKGRGSDPVTSAAKHDINRDLRAWPIAVKGERKKWGIMRRGFGVKGWSGEVLKAPWLFRATRRVCPEVPHTVCFLTFPGNSLSLLNSLMYFFLFRLKGVDISVTEPNFFNMKVLTRSRLWGKRMLHAFSINQQQPKRQEQTHEHKNLCSLPQIILSLWKMNEIRNTPVHIIYTQSPLTAGTPRSFWTWVFYYITAVMKEKKIYEKCYLCVNNYRVTTW